MVWQGPEGNPWGSSNFSAAYDLSPILSDMMGLRPADDVSVADIAIVDRPAWRTSVKNESAYQPERASFEGKLPAS
jgi:hypothetical protein